MEKTPGGTGLRLCAPCLFGLEGPLGNELRHMGMSSVAPENGRVFFETDEYGLARANICSRFAERILLETDCPYLAPEPNRGRRNSSLNLPYVAAAIGELKGADADEVIRVTNENAKKMYFGGRTI